MKNLLHKPWFISAVAIYVLVVLIVTFIPSSPKDEEVKSEPETSQVEPESTPEPETVEETETTEKPEEDEGTKVAEAMFAYVDEAHDLQEGISRAKLIENLEKDGYSTKTIEATVDDVFISSDWESEAVRMARWYIAHSKSMTKSKMINQLKYEGFTQKEAVYAAGKVGLN